MLRFFLMMSEQDMMRRIDILESMVEFLDRRVKELEKLAGVSDDLQEKIRAEAEKAGWRNR